MGLLPLTVIWGVAYHTDGGTVKSAVIGTLSVWPAGEAGYEERVNRKNLRVPFGRAPYHNSDSQNLPVTGEQRT